MNTTPFRFQPSAPNGVRGAAFSRPFRGMATLIVLGSAAWLGLLVGRDELVMNAGSLGGSGWFYAALALMLWTWWSILRSHTRIDASGLYQHWVWDKRMAFDDLAYAKLIRVRGLEWLIAPRLYTRTLLGKFAVFYAGTPALVAECERLTHELRAFRHPA